MQPTTRDETIATVADLVGDKWSMLVVRDVFRGVRRFDDLCADLGMSRAVLTGRLKKLVAAGVLTKVP
jgi:DNA-binding HxlR family transcriptional regulator